MPQIEAIFEVDANGVLNVSAHDKSISSKLAVASNKGYMYKEDIVRMASAAENDR
ncbi:hypothetical protein GGF42_005520 [Coemansia sp. RSA 2424]|nr:hypothetical protein GGF42_005520 [Coemansia sp. RSA 2424]